MGNETRGIRGPSMTAYDTTLADLGRTLSGRLPADEPEVLAADRRALREAVAEAERRCHDAYEAMIEAGADICLSQPFRIGRAVYGLGCPRIWPVVGKSTADVLADCRQKLTSARERGRIGHWTFDPNQVIALQQAERALTAMLSREADDAQERRRIRGSAMSDTDSMPSVGAGASVPQAEAPVDAVCIVAADFNGRSFDGLPFSAMPEWLSARLCDETIRIGGLGHTDYARWIVPTNIGLILCEPGDWIVFDPKADCLTVYPHDSLAARLLFAKQRPRKADSPTERDPIEREGR